MHFPRFFSPLAITEAINVGSALAFSLLCNVSPTAAVDEWFCQYPALEEVEDFYPDFMHFFTRGEGERGVRRRAQNAIASDANTTAYTSSQDVPASIMTLQF